MKALRTATAAWLAAAGLAAAQDAAKRGYLGVVTVRAPDGELVVSVDAQGPAAAAGVQVGNTILKVDDRALTPQHTLRDMIRAKNPSQSVRLAVRNSTGAVQEKSVALRERPAVSPFNQRSFYRNPGDDDDEEAWQSARALQDYFTQQAQFMQPAGPRPMLGVTVVDPDPQMRERLKLGNAPGVMISEVRTGTPAADAKLQANDFIQSIDGKPVSNAGDLQQTVASVKPGAPVKLKVIRGGQPLDVAVTVKSMTAPFPPRGFPQALPPTPGMATGGTVDIVAELNSLKQRVQQLEARVQQLEGRAGAPAGVGGPPAAPKTNIPPRGGSQPDR